jgi:hypothetical protein
VSTDPYAGFSDRLYTLGFETYADYLATPRWQKMRRDFRRLRPKANKCFCCGGPWRDLHHPDYRRLGRETVFELIPVCGGCHLEIHRIVRDDDVPLRVAHRELAGRHAYMMELRM